MRLLNFLFLISLMPIASVVQSSELDKDVYVEFEIPAILQLDIDSSELSISSSNQGVLEYKDLIKGNLSSNIPWKITAKLQNNLSKTSHIELKDKIVGKWQPLDQYNPILLAEGERATHNREVIIDASLHNPKEEDKTPIVIILTISSQTPHLLKTEKGAKINETH
jgi:hypothetical protein